jgi:hypothetical protein
MTINHIKRRRMLDNQLYVRRAGAAAITLGIIVLIAAFAILAFIWAHPVV